MCHRHVLAESAPLEGLLAGVYRVEEEGGACLGPWDVASMSLPAVGDAEVSGGLWTMGSQVSYVMQAYAHIGPSGA